MERRVFNLANVCRSEMVAATIVFVFLVVASCHKENENALASFKKESLTGLVQIGPFTRAAVSIYDLSTDLKLTGKAFNTEVISGNGFFEFRNFSLSSQYAELKANGYYYNAVSDSESSYHISLTALSDLKDQPAVNINILTDLETERVKFLVSKGKAFSEAKDSAQAEILRIFGMTHWNTDISEKLDISEAGEGNAMLLALTVILQGNRSPRVLYRLLEEISEDIRQDGLLDNDSIIKDLRNTAINLDLVKIRSNLENRYRKLNIAVTVPDFEISMNRFFYHTASAPENTTLEATNITLTGARLNGTVNANDQGAAVTFDYGPTLAYGYVTPAPPTKIVVTGRTSKSVFMDVSGLNPGTLYHYRIKAEYLNDTVMGIDRTFTTLGSTPLVVTLAASNLLVDGAKLNGIVNADYLPTAVSFEYGATDSYGNVVPANPGQVTGNTVTNVSVNLTGLSAGAIYHYRIKATNSLGTRFGNDVIFTTLGAVPKVTTLYATDPSVAGVTLRAMVNANYLTSAVSFEYGLTNEYGSIVDAFPAQISGNNDVSVTASLDGLAPGTIYHCRVKAINSLGTTYGNDLTFKTLGDLPSANIKDATKIHATYALLQGSINPNYLKTDVIFQYGISTNYGDSIVATESPLNGYNVYNVSGLINNLLPETLYHFRIKAVNALGTTYSIDNLLPTPPQVIYDVDGNSYTAITIGSQVWLGENLITTRFTDGTPIAMVTDATTWAGLNTPAYCWYNNDSTNKHSYGAFYNWNTVDPNTNGSRQICPAGWHVPQTSDWSTLSNYLEGNGVGLLAIIGTNETGFTAVPAGIRTLEGYFDFFGNEAGFYTSSYWGASTSVNTYMVAVTIMSFGFDRRTGVPIRCIKDQ